MNFIFNKTVFFWLVAFSISLPIFLGVSSNGITIIQLWDRKDAFPIHISMPFIVILGFYYNVFRIQKDDVDDNELRELRSDEEKEKTKNLSSVHKFLNQPA